VYELLDRNADCRLFGGTRPINSATLYRGIRLGRFPKPLHVGRSSRWLREECEAVLAGMAQSRGSTSEPTVPDGNRRSA
jgi:predicted DNA-binding transcriptional regulator AlpA